MPTNIAHARACRWRAALVVLCGMTAFAAAFNANAAAPTISGSPPTSVRVDFSYYFRPAVSDPDTAASALRYSIANKPGWASFSSTTGALQGAPKSAGRWSNIVIAVSDGRASTKLPAFAITAFTSTSGNRAPRIFGTPATSATIGKWYNFLPTASDPNGNSLRFSIRNRPGWLTFNTATGRLSGTAGSANVGMYSNIVISVSDGMATATLPAFSIVVRSSSSSSTGNQTPTLSGTPTTSVRIGLAYSFTPTARDANGDPLTFSISNKPAWAAFNTSTGRLSGTPTSMHVGAYSNIVIRVSDGKSSAYLPAFSIAVTSTANGSATLNWTPPTRNTDGTTLTNLAGYRIYYGTSTGAMNQRIQIANPGLAGYVVENLSPATWYFTVKAYSTSGSESTASNTASKTIR